MFQRMLGEEHPNKLMSMSSLAVTCYQMGDRDRGIELMTQAAHGRLVKLGPAHPDTQSALGWLAHWGAAAERPSLWQRLHRALGAGG